MVGRRTVKEGHFGAVLLLQEAVEGNEHHLHGELIRLHTQRTHPVRHPDFIAH